MRALNYARSFVHSLYVCDCVLATADPTLLLLCSSLFDIFSVRPLLKTHFIRCAKIFRFRLIFHDFYANFLMVLESAVTTTVAVNGIGSGGGDGVYYDLYISKAAIHLRSFFEFSFFFR